MTRQSHSREALAALFWPEYEARSAYAYLRRTLWEINEILGKGRVLADRETVELVRGPDLYLDVDEFRELVAATRARSGSGVLSPDSLGPVERAAQVYQDDLLAGFGLKDAPGFDDWLFFEREGLKRDLANVLETLARSYAEQRRPIDAVSFARRRLALDPLDEAAHRALMQVYELAGQHAAALRQYEECARILHAELGARPEPGTTRLYEQLRAGKAGATAGEPADSGQGSVRAQGRHNLPSAATPFIGRELELARIAALLENPDCRLVSLIGQGGAGKSRLALEAARRQLDLFSNRVYWVPLAPLNDARFIVSAIADAIGFSFFGAASGPEDPMQKRELLDYLSGKEMLLVLDNFEHLMREAALLSEILQAAGQVKLLVTSRQRLNLQEEWTVAVEGMGVPAPQANQDLEEYASVRLFAACVRRMVGDWSLADIDRQSIIRICRAVDGLPLGLELAAGWAHTLSLVEIADEIEHNLDFLRATVHNLPERHSSLGAVFDSSWKLLSSAERQVFCRLSVFRGPFTREAATAVAGATLPLLTSLLDQSMLYHEPRGRFGLHEALRQYGGAKLAAVSEDQAQTLERHSAYYVERARAWDRQLRGREQLQALEAMTLDLENIRSAFRWSLERRRSDMVLSLLTSLAFFCDYRSRFQEAEMLLEQAVSDWGADNIETDENRVVRAGLLAWQAWFCYRLGRMGLAAEGAAAARAALEGIGWEAGEVKATVNLLTGELVEQSLEELQAIVEETRRYFESHNDRWGLARLVGYTAGLTWYSGQPRECEPLYLEGLEMFRQLGDMRGEMELLGQLGNLYQHTGRFEQAREQYEAGLRRARELGDRWAIHLNLDNLGYLLRRLGKFQEARRDHEESLAISREIGDALGIGGALDNLGLVAFDTGDYAEAKQLFQEGLEYRRASGQMGSTVFSLGHLAELAFVSGDAARAEEMIRDVLARFPYETADIAPYRLHNILGDIARSRGQMEQAQEQYREALVLARRMSNTSVIMESLVGLAVSSPAAGSGRAVEILTFVLQHPASDYATCRRARQLLDQETGKLSAEMRQAAEGRGRALTLESALEPILTGRSDLLTPKARIRMDL